MSPLEIFRDLLARAGCKPTATGALCPAHKDTVPSLSFHAGRKGVVWKCHRGCESMAIWNALDATSAEADAVLAGRKLNGHAEGVPFVYQDEQGAPYMRVVRTRGPDGRKRYVQQRPDGHGGWINGLKGRPPILYRLPEVLKAIADGRPIHIVEGEKCADQLAWAGFCATTNPGGAGEWSPSFSGLLAKSQQLVTWADNDPSGEAHVLTIWRSLKAAGASPRTSPARATATMVRNMISPPLSWRLISSF